MSLIAALLLVSAASAVAPPQAASPATETLATHTDVADRMTLPASVNGQGPFSFTIDTGADHSVVSDDLAAQLNLPSKPSATLYGIIGPQQVAMVSLDRLQIGKRERRGLAAPVLPRLALGAQGFIGLDALANESVLLDFRHKTIRIATTAADAMVGDPDVIVVTARSRFGQLIMTDASINGVKVYAVIDTGAQNTIGNMALRRMMGSGGPLIDHGVHIEGVTGAELVAEMGRIPAIQLGTMTLKNMPIAYADVQTFKRFDVDNKPAILLGMDVLRGFERVAVDFRRRKVRFLVGPGAATGTPTLTASVQGTPPKLGI
jgi:predicted aspartyl protease